MEALSLLRLACLSLLVSGQPLGSCHIGTVRHRAAGLSGVSLAKEWRWGEVSVRVGGHVLGRARERRTLLQRDRSQWLRVCCRCSLAGCTEQLCLLARLRQACFSCCHRVHLFGCGRERLDLCCSQRGWGTRIKLLNVWLRSLCWHGILQLQATVDLRLWFCLSAVQS